MSDFIISYRYLLALCCLLAGLSVSCSAHAGIYDILTSIFSSIPPPQNLEAETYPQIMVSAPDLVLTHKELRTRMMPVALYSDSGHQELPNLQIHWTTDGINWNFLGDNSCFPDMKLDTQQSLLVTLPNIMPAAGLQWIVVRIRLLTPGQTTTHSVIAVLPDTSDQSGKPKAVAYDIDGTLALISNFPDGRQIPFSKITAELRNQVESGYMVFYVTSRCRAGNTITRHWLRTYNLPAGIICAASCLLSSAPKHEEIRKKTKARTLQNIMTYVRLEEFSGDSVVSDILAAMQARVPIVHWIAWVTQEHNAGMLAAKKPGAYQKLRVERLFPPVRSFMLKVHRHSFKLCSVYLHEPSEHPEARLKCDYRKDLHRAESSIARGQMQEIKETLQQSLTGDFPDMAEAQAFGIEPY